ncbi:MAG TPA: Trm112 family protein [Stellaceae bacterium]|nr:Trm112 family protein [Stellaceae bacterium]
MDEPVDIDPKLLEILVCPLTKAPLRYDRAAQELVSEEAGLAYPIRDGIPIMLVDEARPLRDGEQAPKRLPPVSERGEG